MKIVEILLCLLAVLTLVPVLVVFVQVSMALPTCRPRGLCDGRRPAVGVVIPAHNEALGIVATLRAVVPQLVAGDRLLVVADNCTDDTARIATEAGAEVVERTDHKHRGKGYALDFGVRHLERNPPEVVLIIDADCEIESGAIERLSRLCLETSRPVQALYLMYSPKGAGLKVRIGEFAWVVKNHVRALGFHRLGLPCQLMGTGMAFPWASICNAALASGHIVEDMKLGIDLALAGTPALFCPEARVTSYFPATAEGLSSQRARWEHGHIGVILSVAPKLFLQALRRCDLNLFALALDLCVPPLALLMLQVLSIFAGCVIFFVATAVVLPMVASSILLIIIIFSVLLAWGAYGRRIVSLTDLARTPFYVLWKIPLYLKFLVRRQAEWVRSRRDAD